MKRGVLLLFVLLLLPAGHLGAQSVRGWARSTVRYVQMRPLDRDTIDIDEAREIADGFYVYEGTPVTCTPGLHCILYRMQPVDHVVHGTQDLRLTAWGLGVQGLSATVLLRGRTDLAGDFTWPRSDDPFDAFLAYGELARSGFRIRLGRQEMRSGLGTSAFDGASARWAPLERLRVEAYGGRSLARGLREPRHEVLQGLQKFVPDQEAYLAGGAVEADLFRGTAVVLRYQREIWADRSGLISERASLDARSVALSPVRLDASADYDFAFGRVGKAHLTARLPIRPLRMGLEATLRRYVPYFELHTIWGFFDPVAYHEARLRANWSPSSAFALWLAGGRRVYGDTHTTTFLTSLAPLEGDAWRVSAGATWRPVPAWAVDGRYQLEWANGAFLSSGDVSVRWEPHPRVRLSATGTALQQFEEYRLGEGTTVGGGGSASVRLTSRLHLDGGVSVYRRLTEDRLYEVGEDWSQTRGWTSLRVDLGRDPGMEGGDG